MNLLIKFLDFRFLVTPFADEDSLEIWIILVMIALFTVLGVITKAGIYNILAIPFVIYLILELLEHEEDATFQIIGLAGFAVWLAFSAFMDHGE